VWLHAGLVAAAAAAALTGGFFSTVRKRSFPSVGLGTAAVMLAAVTTFYLFTPLGGILPAYLLDETLIMNGLAAFICLTIATAVAASTAGVDTARPRPPPHGSM